MKLLKLALLAMTACLMLEGCGTFNSSSDQDIDSPTVGTAQTGDPAIVDHRN